MSGKREVIRQHQCAHCRTMVDYSVIKMCGGVRPPAVCFCPRPVSQEMIDEVAGWMKPMDDGSGPGSEPMTTEGLIKLFDMRALCEPEYKRKLTIMAPTG
ncbi:hypothetical protein V8D89_010069 [Ganoderma adspersum]